MEGLSSFLLFALFFFFMMRFGCGAHMMHGHGGYKHSRDEAAEDNDNAGKYIDPVCDMEVQTDQGYGKMYQGTLYRFCSKSCLDKFDAEPGPYINKQKALLEEEHHDH